MLAVETGYFPTGGMVSPGPERVLDVAWHLVLPVAVLVLGMLPTLVRHVRASMAEAIDSPFALSAGRKGIPRPAPAVRHLLPAAANPLISLFGFSLGTLLSASLLIEVVMGWPDWARSSWRPSWPGISPWCWRGDAVGRRSWWLATCWPTFLLYRHGPSDSNAMTRRTKIAAALIFLGILHGLALFAGFLAPYPYAEQHREFPYAPPTPIHLSRLQFPGPRAPVWRARSPASSSCSAPMLTARTCFSRLLYGGRVSLFTGLLAAFLSLRPGLGAGDGRGLLRRMARSAPHARGRARDGSAVALFVARCAGISAAPHHFGSGVFLIVVIIGGVGWVRPARLIRGVVLSARERGFVLAARGFGASVPI